MNCNINEIKEIWGNRKRTPEETFHIYLHIPFCVGICSYCIYSSADIYNTDRKVYDDYFKSLINQIDEFRDILESKNVDSLYIGGGTPSVMPFETLIDISKKIPNFKDIKVKVFEGNPVSINRKKIDILSDLGFTYLTLGVQTLDEEELKKQNRNKAKDNHLKDITDYALSKGMFVNFDILALLDEVIEEDSVRLGNDLEVLMKDYKPSAIDIYPMYQRLLGGVSDRDKIERARGVRRTIRKALFNNKDYHIGLGQGLLDTSSEETLLSQAQKNFYLLRVSDEEFFGGYKKYSCSGPEHAPAHQNVIGFGGFGDLSVYSYGSEKQFSYFTKIDESGKVTYDLRNRR